MGFIKINLNDNKAAQDLHSQTIYKKGIETTIVSEAHCKNKSGTWATVTQ